jgi:ribose 5-phosphate isomerase B
MKIAIGSDDHTHLTNFLIKELKQRGHEVVSFGLPLPLSLILFSAR